MKRRNFLKSLVWLPLTGKAMEILHQENGFSSNGNNTVMPMMFVGHGSPLNALEENKFSRGWRSMAAQVPVPRAILCISAHWETRGTLVTAMERPRTIHDFYGFPDELFAVEYPAKGSPETARETIANSPEQSFKPDYEWGLDHGTWSVLRHLYPQANIPVLQLSLDYTLKPGQHFQLAKSLSSLRRRGVLIVGSGNIVHNLRMLNWNDPENGYPWAEEVSSRVKSIMLAREQERLTEYGAMGREFAQAIPTPEHFLPALYILSMFGKDEEVSFFNDQCVMGSLSMTSFLIKSNP
jgi:4,5-DOPA dioxygenase extradiol